jgi:hypothetical protein
MKLEKTWSASSKPESFEIADELINMVGQWNIGIDVDINLPYTYSNGPIINNIVD